MQYDTASVDNVKSAYVFGIAISVMPAPSTPDINEQSAECMINYWPSQISVLGNTIAQPIVESTSANPVFLVTNSINSMVKLPFAIENRR